MRFIPRIVFQIVGFLALASSMILPVIWWTTNRGLFALWKGWLYSWFNSPLRLNLVVFVLTLLSCLLVALAGILILQPFVKDPPSSFDKEQMQQILKGELDYDQPITRKIFRGIGLALVGLGVIILIISWLFWQEYSEMYIKLPVAGFAFIGVGLYCALTGKLPRPPQIRDFFKKK
ncbi:hypothetical protein CH373_12750 [Leptospira perolatii]|uniref:Uncharacterized protein n=1 Tax=Leptospira perolatii TaxID=2023191 RepID=A0A2M9ZLF8_9LEPT|nr:hypothetical protein [Leptospira perolatii]PJZ70199.1 hypothetical protein CH360_06220 [Leptospira perolatii]PJZ72916.1 hypothetical protein CH373_12750 [Leptospira perolatii]